MMLSLKNWRNEQGRKLMEKFNLIWLWLNDLDQEFEEFCRNFDLNPFHEVTFKMFKNQVEVDYGKTG